MSVPDAAVSFLLENITQILKYNYELVANVEGNIRALQTELQALEGLMKDFAKYNHDSDYLKTMVKQIKSIVDDAEDAVDTYVVHAAVQKSRTWIAKTFKVIDYPIKLREVGKQIKEISNKINQFHQVKAPGAYQILQNQATGKHSQRAKSKEDPKVEEEHVVGFDGAISHVSQLLTKGSEQLEVISIVGMLGLGKTTLAKKVFSHRDVDYEYMIRVFVYVSKEYERKEVFLKILRSFTQVEDKVNEMSEDELEKHLCKNLKGKQYLIVLDDVWEKEDWDRLKDAFPNNDKRCRVLITTRYEKVAEHAKNAGTPFYTLDFLPLDKSRELLRWKVFRDNDSREEFDKHEEQIAKKCDGLPLAIVVIAGIIGNHKDSVDWWKHVAESVEDYIARDQEQTYKVIELMYKHLPNQLKLCFMYLGVFPEDFEIPVWKLVRLWVAEGLIRQDSNLNLEDVAEEYLEELVYRNLVMVGKRRSNHKIKTCTLHDTLREFCKKQAKEESLFQEIKKDNRCGNSVLDQHRRLCINNANVLEFISSPPSGKRVRSLLTFAREETTVEPKYVSSIPKTFKLLRVLEIQALKFSRFPIDLNHLVLLKYIAISSNFQSLPETMSALWNMQTLIVNTEFPTLEIKADIWKLPQLRHLHTNTSTILPCLDSKNQKKKNEVLIVQNIQTLSTIAPESCKKEILDRASKLKKLGIRGRLTKLFEKGSGLFDNLRDLASLENLKLVNDDVSSKLDSLPSDKRFPQQLTKLTLSGTLLGWKEMAKLGKLENLEILKLKERAFQGKKWLSEEGGFLQLKHLHIGTTDLEDWEASAEHFPKLKCLELHGCSDLKAVPDGLADISSLQSVILHCTNPKVASSALILKTKKDEKNSNFRLSVYPPDHLKNNPGI